MRSVTLRIFLCAVLGLLTTLAIAWTCAAFVEFGDDRPWETATLRQDGSMEWRLVQQGPGRTRTAYIIGPPTPANDPLHVPLMDAFSILRPDSSGSIEEVGWPFRAMRCRNDQITIITSTLALQVATGEEGVQAGIALPDRVQNGVSDWRALPYQPMWIGLTLDVVIFAIAWLGVLHGLVPVRSLIRRRRGRCPKCGYDLRGQVVTDVVAEESARARIPGCPECGWNRGT